jgi:hypothetical protein
VAKKAKGSKKVKQSLKKDEVAATVPTPEPGYVNVTMSPTDVATLANLLSVCSQTFERLANQAIKENDEVSFNILVARHKLSSAFAHKFLDSTKIGEPESRSLH